MPSNCKGNTWVLSPYYVYIFSASVRTSLCRRHPLSMAWLGPRCGASNSKYEICKTVGTWNAMRVEGRSGWVPGFESQVLPTPDDGERLRDTHRERERQPGRHQLGWGFVWIVECGCRKLSWLSSFRMCWPLTFIAVVAPVDYAGFCGGCALVIPEGFGFGFGFGHTHTL